MSRHGRIMNCAALVLLMATPAFAAGYEAELDPAPFDATSRADMITAIGNVTAALDGSTLNIHGSFSGLTSNATAASVRIGLAKGVPGDAIGTLMVSHAKAGDVSGAVKLSSAQAAALKKQALYIRIDSEKAADGNLQGWLEAGSN